MSERKWELRDKLWSHWFWNSLYQEQVGTSVFLIWLKFTVMDTKSWKSPFFVHVSEALSKYIQIKTESELFKSGSFIIGSSQNRCVYFHREQLQLKISFYNP